MNYLGRRNEIEIEVFDIRLIYCFTICFGKWVNSKSEFRDWRQWIAILCRTLSHYRRWWSPFAILVVRMNILTEWHLSSSTFFFTLAPMVKIVERYWLQWHKRRQLCHRQQWPFCQWRHQCHCQNGAINAVCAISTGYYPLDSLTVFGDNFEKLYLDKMSILAPLSGDIFVVMAPIEKIWRQARQSGFVLTTSSLFSCIWTVRSFDCLDYYLK